MKHNKKLIDVTDINYNERFVSLKITYSEFEIKRGFLGNIYTGAETRTRRNITGYRLDNVACSIILNFDDTGENVYEILGLDLEKVIVGKINLYISKQENKILPLTNSHIVKKKCPKCNSDMEFDKSMILNSFPATNKARCSNKECGLIEYVII